MKNLSLQNGGFIRAFWLVPDSWGISRGCREWRIIFSIASFAKIFISRLKMEKSFTRKKKCLTTHSGWLFYEKQQFWTEYIQKSSFNNKLSSLLCKPKQNPKDQDKLKLNRYVLQIFPGTPERSEGKGGRFSWNGTFELIYAKRCFQNIGSYFP
jgi:hypothetical protein